jgi:hypothetical protein
LSGHAGQPSLVPNRHFVNELLSSRPQFQDFAISGPNRDNAFLSEFRKETPPAREQIGHNLFTQRNAINGVYKDDRPAVKSGMRNLVHERGLLNIERKTWEKSLMEDDPALTTLIRRWSETVSAGELCLGKRIEVSKKHHG